MINTYIDFLEQDQLLISRQNDLAKMGFGTPVTDHRLIQPGDTFIAIKGLSFDGHDLIPQAKKAGAKLIIGETPAADIRVTDSRKAAALYAKVFFQDPSTKFTLIGVTGTNGKTTTSLMLYQMLSSLGYSCGWIGTLGYKVGTESFATNHTTPDIIELNQIFKAMVDAGISHVIMEVSSHALSLDRVYGVNFQYALFTNLSRDHLDFHKDIESYFEAKYLLFERTKQNNGCLIINTDDAHGQIIYQRMQGAKVKSVSHQMADYTILDDRLSLHGSEFYLRKGTEDTKIESPLIGSFNIDNLALALATLDAMQLGGKDKSKPSLAQFVDLCKNLAAVRGRMEAVPNSRNIGVYIDYAHTPDAITNALKSCQKLPHKRIICVFGAGGDRDKGKRPLMLKAALSESDAVIVTDDNPRSENPDNIISEIVQNADPCLPWWIIRDRKEAICSALRLANPGDIVVICGKGHETYQEIEGVRYDFDDLAIAKEALSSDKMKLEDDELVLAVDPLLIKILENVTFTAKGYCAPKSYYRISTDSRDISSGSAFFAIRGESFDGNSFIPSVLKDQMNFAVGNLDLNDPTMQGLNNATLGSPIPYLQVTDTVKILSRVMNKYLQMFPAFKIALTGSTGKTSTKEILANILERVSPTLKTLKNENNIIGLCKTIMRIRPQHEYAVFEIGTNHFGEINQLADTIIPDAGIILNIGPSHLEFFGDEDGVFKEKTDLFRRALAFRIFPADDQRFTVYKDEGISVGYCDNADLQICNYSQHEDGQSFSFAENQWNIKQIAKHYVINTAFAIALALKLNIPKGKIQEALDAPLNLGLRMNVIPFKKGRLIVDCYNANPVSMQAAIEFWKHLSPDSPHVAFLGDMLELGESSAMYHNMIGAILSEIPDLTIYSIGQYARLYAPEERYHYPRVESILGDFPSLPEDAIVLVKASHGIHLEKLLPLLTGEE